MTIPEQPISADEAVKFRDLMNTDEEKSTENLSTISRSIAIGLALVTYTFFIESKSNDFVTHNFLGLLAASMLGVLALTVDALHYLFAMFQVRLLRRRIKQQINATGALTTTNVADFNENAFYWLRWAAFWGKLVLVACGAAVVIAIVLRSAATLANF